MQFHFNFHNVPDLPEALVQGNEAAYLEHFFNKLCLNPAGLTDKDREHYVKEYSMPGAMRNGMSVYRAFEADKEENIEWMKKEGKCKVPCLVLSGEGGPFVEEAEGMASEMYDGPLEVAKVAGAGHWVAEENPEGFVEAVLKFVDKYEK